eukprot:scaffold4847_cov265-Pinguiococcus_pyrenoidosus.AAC.4
MVYQWIAVLLLWQCAAVEGKRRAFVHIGPHKVASTYIQHLACANREQLKELGIHIPMSKICTIIPHRREGSCAKYFSGVAMSLIEVGRSASLPSPMVIPHEVVEDLQSVHQCHNETKGAIASLRETLAEIDGDVFISAELFDQVKPEGAAYLKDVLKDFDVKILVLFREPFDHIMSLYQEALKVNEIVVPLPDFVVSVASKIISGLNLDFMLHSYCSAFGEENVYVYGFDGLLDAGEEIFSFILRNFMGVDLPLSKAAIVKNTSPELSYMSLWAFIQESLVLRGRPQEEIAKFPLFLENPAGAQCLEKAAPRLITQLGDAWICKDMGVMDAGLQARDIEAIKSRPQLNVQFVNETKKADGLFVERKKSACFVQTSNLLALPGRLQILADMEKLMEAVRNVETPCPWT